MAAPATNNAKPGPIDQNDINDWSVRLNEALAKPGDTLNSKSPESSSSWTSSLFGCFNPIDTCLLTCCLPCITFGKVHHRTRKNGNMQGYEPVNTSCLLFMGTGCFGLHWIPQSMQRADLRRKYNLQGSCLTDIALSCCCGCCDLVQQEKESELREAEMAQTTQYKNSDAMVYERQ